MADVTGFLKIKRKEAGNRPLNERVCDHSEVEQIISSPNGMIFFTKATGRLHTSDWHPQITSLNLPEEYVLHHVNMHVC